MLIILQFAHRAIICNVEAYLIIKRYIKIIPLIILPIASHTVPRDSPIKTNSSTSVKFCGSQILSK